MLDVVAAPEEASGVQAVAAMVRVCDRELQRCVLDQDIEALREMLAEDWVLIASTGKVYSREAFLEVAGNPRSRLAVNSSSDVEVRIFKTTAIVTARLHERGVEGGLSHEAWLLYTDVWSLERGAWRCVSAHACRCQPANAAA